WRQLAHMYAVSRPPLLSALLQEQGVTETTAFADRLRSAAPSERFNLAVAHVQAELASILGLADLPDPNAGFFDLGMDSLSATRLAGRISAVVGTNVSARRVFDATTVAELAQVVVTGRDGDTDNPITIPTDDRGVEAIVSPAQERVLAGEDITRDHNVVTSTSVLELCGPVDIAALEQTFRTLVDRHETLRTRFVRGAAGAYSPVVDSADGFKLTVHYIDDDRRPHARERARQEAERAFDPFDGPVFRATLLVLDDNDALLIVGAHHVAVDIASFAVLWEEIASIYPARVSGTSVNLPPIGQPYRLFAEQARVELTPSRRSELEAFWRERLAGAPAWIDLPSDRPRPAVLSRRAGRVRRSISSDLADRIRRVAGEHHLTPFVVIET
ncbi:MAG: hypothetical protein GY798_08405, partial [Hyphomicrobiales bacterium]|nr:hypothetical protein [Hyphomicrobiales bacterium]